MSKWKMATIQRIHKIIHIPAAENIEIATLNCFRVVVEKEIFREGDLCIYCKVDSFIPNSIAPFLTKKGENPKEYLGVKGEVIKIKKIQGIISEGLLLPLTEDITRRFIGVVKHYNDYVGLDVSEILGITRYKN